LFFIQTNQPDKLIAIVTTYWRTFLGYEQAGYILPQQILTVLNSLKVEPSSAASTTAIIPIEKSAYQFTRNLMIGSVGADVTALQKFLVAQGAGPAAQALSTHGTTKVFGQLTKAALIEYQKKSGIVPASGYFGSLTRAYIASH
jgi:murein L,D-transpeptidase YcbB/YkuD